MSRDNRTVFNKTIDLVSYLVISFLFLLSKLVPIYIFSFFFGCLAVFMSPFLPATYIVMRNLKRNTDFNLFKRIMTTFGVWYNLGCFVGEYPYIYKIKKNKVFDYVSIENPEMIEKIKNNNGIIISAHLSNWEFGLRAINDLGVKTNVVFRKLNNVFVEEKYTAKLREDVGIKMIAKQDNAAIKIIRALKNKENVVILVDQRDKMNGVLVKFFKNKAYTIKTVYTISNKLKIPVYAIRIVRTGFVKFILKIEKLEEKPEDEFLLYMNGILERWIMENIYQWFWVHNRWKIK